jgi:uncharacterized membrane protein YqgA involved in biofilm formation
MRMPVGSIVNSLCLVSGGIIGSLAASRLSERIKRSLTLVFALGAMAMGMISITRASAMPAVVLALVIGVFLGAVLDVEGLLKRAGEWTASRFARNMAGNPAAYRHFLDMFALAVVLFCFGPVGMYGAMQSSLSGDHSLLLFKAVMDFFTAFIFAASLGLPVCFIALPLLAVQLSFFFLATFIQTVTTPGMFGDFTACGGIIICSSAFRMAEIKSFPSGDMSIALFLVMPISFLWNLLPL